MKPNELLARYHARREAAVQRRLANGPDFGVGNYRSSSRPGQVGRVVAPSRRQGFLRPPPQPAWQRRPPGFVGQGSSATIYNPYGPATATIVPPGMPPPTGVPLDPSGQPGGGGTIPPPYPCPMGMDPQWWDFHRGCPIEFAPPCTGGVTQGCESAQPCGVNSIGANTLGTDGIPPGEVVPLPVTAGDATKFHTKTLYFEALPFGDTDLVDVAALPPGRSTMPLILVDALVGRISQLRRGGSPDVGLTQGGYSNTKPLVAVDWAPFTSTTEHNLVLLFFNPNRGQTVHAFVDLWGDI